MSKKLYKVDGNGFKCLKMDNKCVLPKKGQKQQKMEIIKKYQKLITKYGGKMSKMPIREKDCQLSQYLFSSFFWIETTPTNATSRFRTIFGSRDTNFGPFFVKIRIF